jgi:hypothetical protein
MGCRRTRRPSGNPAPFAPQARRGRRACRVFPCQVRWFGPTAVSRPPPSAGMTARGRGGRGRWAHVRQSACQGAVGLVGVNALGVAKIENGAASSVGLNSTSALRAPPGHSQRRSAAGTPTACSAEELSRRGGNDSLAALWLSSPRRRPLGSSELYAGPEEQVRVGREWIAASRPGRRIRWRREADSAILLNLNLQSMSVHG